MKKPVFASFTISCLLSTVFLMGVSFNVQPVMASGTIYIRADGSIGPPTESISSVDNVTYTFTDNIHDEIVVERNNTVIDGAGYTLQGYGSGDGFRLYGVSNVTIKDTNISGFFCGIKLKSYERVSVPYGYEYAVVCYNNTVCGNNITNNDWGIGGGDGMGVYSYNNTYSRNIISNNRNDGINLYHSENSMIWGNTIANNERAGVSQTMGKRASNNIFYHNNFVNNTLQVRELWGDVNIWDNGYPTGGNYWSDYNGTDANNDRIGDTPYVINDANRDRYPLMSPWTMPEHELVASIAAPASLQLSSSSSLNATVSNEGINDEVDVELVLLINGTTVDTTTIPLLQAGDSYTLSHLWTPTVEGTCNVTAYAHPVPGETSMENNQMSKDVTVSASALPPEVGIRAGDWIKCDYTVAGWPSGTPYPEWLKVEILGVEGTTATVEVTLHLSDGKEESDTVNVDVVAGSGIMGTLFGFLIAADCSTGDSITMGGDGFTFSVTIDGETTRTYAGASRTVVYSSFSQYGTQLTYYWDKQTGILVEASTTGGGVTATSKAVETNMWEATAPFWMQWWFYAIVAIVVVVSAGAIYLKKRKPTTPPPPSESVEQPE